MAAADNFPEFNAAVAELTLKVQALIADVTGTHATLGPEVAAALLKLEEATTILASATAAAEDAQEAAASVLTFKTEFDAAMLVIGQLTTDVNTLSNQVETALSLLSTTQLALEAALQEIEGISGNLAKVTRLTPAGVTPAGHASSVINTGHTVGNGGLMLLGVYCTTSTPLQMYDILIKVGNTVLYEAKGILGPQSDTFSHFAIAEGLMEITLTNHGNAAAVLTPIVVFTELALV